MDELKTTAINFSKDYLQSDDEKSPEMIMAISELLRVLTIA